MWGETERVWRESGLADDEEGNENAEFLPAEPKIIAWGNPCRTICLLVVCRGFGGSGLRQSPVSDVQCSSRQTVRVHGDMGPTLRRRPPS